MLVSLITIQHTAAKLHSKGDSENRKGFSCSIHNWNVILLTLSSSCVNCNVLLIKLVITAREIRGLHALRKLSDYYVSLITIHQHKPSVKAAVKATEKTGCGSSKAATCSYFRVLHRLCAPINRMQNTSISNVRLWPGGLNFRSSRREARKGPPAGTQRLHQANSSQTSR
jgi:hypothetical protein